LIVNNYLIRSIPMALILLWLLGVPLSLIVILWLLGVSR